MKMFVKKRIPLFVGVAAVLGLAQCDWIRADVSRVFSPPVEMDFPMGEGKQISYPIRSWIDKPYGMRLVLEYVNWDKSNDHDVQKEIPFSFSVSCFHMEHDKEILFFQRHYTQADELYLGGGHIPKQPYSPDSMAWGSGLGGFRLPYGTYRCDFKDTSNPEIKSYLQKAGIVRVFVRIAPTQSLIY